MTPLHTYLRAYRLPSGHFYLLEGFALDRQARRYRQLGHPCFYFVDGILTSVTPNTRAVAFQTPRNLLRLLQRRQVRETLDPEHLRWIRKIARLADQFDFAWHCFSFRRGSRTNWQYKRPDSNFEAWIDEGAFSTNPIRVQADFLGALHELGHLRLQVPNKDVPEVAGETMCWQWAIAHAGEQILPETAADFLHSLRCYLRYHRKLNIRRRRRHSFIRPVPQVARHIFAEFGACFDNWKKYEIPLGELLNANAQRRAVRGPTAAVAYRNPRRR